MKIKKLDNLIIFCVPCFSLMLAISQTSFALDLSSDSSLGGSSFVEALSADGDFGAKKKEDKPKGIWNSDYTLTKTKIVNSSGTDVNDNTSEFDAGIGQSKKEAYEYGVGLTFATTPEESLKDFGPNVYFSLSSSLGQKTEDFTPLKTFKLTLSELTYVQTFSTTVTGRNGQTKPGTGSSSISQVFPKIEADLDLISAFSFKLAYTYYVYSRNVNDFLQTLDSPRAVAVGLGNLSNSVSGFNTDLKEIDFTITPFESWEMDLQGTEATSAIDSSSGWTGKGGFLYDFSKKWRAGLAFEYIHNSLITDHVFTLSLKFSND